MTAALLSITEVLKRLARHSRPDRLKIHRGQRGDTGLQTEVDALKAAIAELLRLLLTATVYQVGLEQPATC